jgi:hypothetical protein
VVKRERRRAIMNNVLVATSVPFFLAYGDRKNPVTVHNVIITGSTLFWLLGDDAISSYAKENSGWQTFASMWSYGAPVANGLGLWLWFDKFEKKQGERFIAGISPVKVNKSDGTQIPITSYLRGSDATQLNKNKHTVLATLAQNSTGAGVVRAELNSGTLTIYVDAIPSSIPADTVSVAWAIDTNPIVNAQAS